jgi:hypothetical protein
MKQRIYWSSKKTSGARYVIVVFGRDRSLSQHDVYRLTSFMTPLVDRSVLPPVLDHESRPFQTLPYVNDTLRVPVGYNRLVHPR